MKTDYKPMYRSRDDRMIGGVCAGLGEYFGIDPTVVRIIFALFAVFGVFGPALLTYLVLLIVIPEEPFLSPTAPAPEAPVEAEVMVEDPTEEKEETPEA